MRQQGRGRPIISVEAGGVRHVFVGDTTYSGRWITFTDFLIGYAKTTLGLAWGEAEQKKPVDEQHPYIQWCAALAQLLSNIEPQTPLAFARCLAMVLRRVSTAWLMICT